MHIVLLGVGMHFVVLGFVNVSGDCSQESVEHIYMHIRLYNITGLLMGQVLIIFDRADGQAWC